MVERRRPIQLLPGVNQTDTLTKFFAATVDHLFQPESVEFLSAYIGEKPAYYNSLKDYYVREANKPRQDYQLPPTSVSKDPQSGNITNIMFYYDYLLNLEFHGANTNNHSRLFDQEYYSWSPPTDIDKMINFTKYVWLPGGPRPIQLMGKTEAKLEIIGKTSYSYTGPYRLTSTNEVINGTLDFTTGLTVQFINDADPTLNNIDWIIDKVGRRIELNPIQPVFCPDWDTWPWDVWGWDGDEEAKIKDYMTVGRSHNPTNYWSIRNVWFHEDVINLSKTYVDFGTARATRPIIEFDSDMQLYDSGIQGIDPVTTVCNNISDVLGTIVGKHKFTIDGITLKDGDTILVTGDSNPYANNRVYTVGGIEKLGEITLFQRGNDPSYGDSVRSIFGNNFENIVLWFDGNSWVQGQQYSHYTAPLFQLYDSNSIPLDDPSVYPGSNFYGSTIFTYALDQYANTDTETQLKLKTDQFGSFVFNNTLVTQTYTYVENHTSISMVGYNWYQENQPDGARYNNGWYIAPMPSRQYILNEFDVMTDTTTFTLDQTPYSLQTPIPSIYVSKITNQIETKLALGIDYTLSSNVITLVTPAKSGDRIEVRSWGRRIPTGRKGHYELPLNLTANPNNLEIDAITVSQFTSHFTTIIQNQVGLVGDAIGTNNYRDTANERGLGLKILQHRASMLRPMILSSGNVTVGINSVQSNTDPMLAMQWTQREYTRFYNRFISALCKLWRNGYSSEQSPEEWITIALKQINLGKTTASAWANSGPEGVQGAYTNSKSSNPTFVPPTATRLGVAPAYYPVVALKNGILTIHCHDGSRIVMADSDGSTLGTLLCNETHTSDPSLLSNPIAAAWLQFELDMYNSMPPRYSNKETVLAFDVRPFTPGKWRTGDYSKAEFLAIKMPMFDRWVISNQVDYQSHSIYDINDPFTWNYSSVSDIDGNPVPGHYQGIYRWFYDTDRPHTHPWEMLGFSQKPTWWDNVYGAAPYTRGNKKLWEDLTAGRIAQGPRAGIATAFVRPRLLKCIPVDDQGDLLAPHDAGCLASLPSVEESQKTWVFGDGSPMESVWMYSLDYSFIIAQYSYLMKPARFVEYNWDTLRTARVLRGLGGSQIIYTDTGNRRSNSQFYVHRENPLELDSNFTIDGESTSTYFGSGGIQHWISEYLVSRSYNITQYLGKIIRGTDVQLAHQMGGFVTKNLYLTADSFGQIGYSDQMVPTENVKIYLYKSSSVKVAFYSGVAITKLSSGWRVVGYDGINQYFTTIPSNQQGNKSTIVVGNERVIWYKTPQTAATRVPYGTVFSSKQEVFDFLISLQRYQESQGWVFDQFESDGNYVYDWLQSGREFLFWSQGNWANGNFIALSPLANYAKFVQPFGNVQFLNGIVAGTYPVLDKFGSYIDGQNLEVLRYDDTITIQSLNDQAIYGLRLFSTTLENVLLIDNKTSFGDTVYDPLYNLSQPRLKLYAYRTNEWNGRVDSPGYFLYQDTTDNQWTLLPNFEKTANDFTKYFNIEQPKNYNTIDSVTGNLVLSGTSLAATDVQVIRDLSNHQIGYQARPYLSKLLLEDSTEFQFYQGFIKQKGTIGSFDRLLRNDSVVPVESNFFYYEEFALRNARFGSTALNINIDFIIPQNQYINNPQQITVYGQQDSNRELDGIITLIPHDPKIVVPPSEYNNESDVLFGLRKFIGPDNKTDLPTVGYVEAGETTWVVGNVTAFGTFWEDKSAAGVTLSDRDTIWQYTNNKNTWDVWQYNKSNVEITYNDSSVTGGNLTTIHCNGTLDIVAGDTIIITGISNVSIDGTWTVSSVSSDQLSFTIPTYTYDVGTGGSIYVYRSVRFMNTTDRDANHPVGGWKNGDKAWVDTGDFGLGGWTVYQHLHGAWQPIRTEEYKVNPKLMLAAKLYSKTKNTVYGILEYYDPAKGYIPGLAQKNLDRISVYDPATYNSGDDSLYPIDESRAWGKNHIGETWWDLSTIRYLDYEQGSLGYRWQNWGKTAHYTSIDVYEWVQSPVDPTGWATYISTNRDFSQFGVGYVPSGTVRDLTNPAYTVVTDYTEVGTSKTWYYFWVKNAITLPFPQNRNLTTQAISNIISNPTAYGVSWYAAIDNRNIIVANIGDRLNTNDTVLSLVYTTKENDQNDYKEWDLIRPHDQFSYIRDYHWAKLKSSLIGKDGLGNEVPDQHLSALSKYGNLVRPRQSWFMDRQAASKTFVNKTNTLLQDILLAEDINALGWLDYFDISELPPLAGTGQWDYKVSNLTERDVLGGNIPSGSKVLVLNGSPLTSLWVIYSYFYDAQTGNWSWTATRQQAYNTMNYWQYIDWYMPNSGISSSSVPDYTVAAIPDKTIYEGTVGTLVKVLNIGDGRWALYQWSDAGWVTVGYQEGTIQILSGLYDNSINTMSWGISGFDTVSFDIYPCIEFGNIFDGLKDVIFTKGALNELFFTMINYVLAEQHFVDWIIKTSYVTLEGFNIPLKQDGLYKPDNIDAIVNYYNEIKPYHAKVRQFITGRTATDNVTVLTSELRTMKVTLLFDRIANMVNGWDVLAWNTPPWDYIVKSQGAIDRIHDYYLPLDGQTNYIPLEGMIRKDDPALITLDDYRGIIIDGDHFGFKGGWSNGQWDPAYGWDGVPPAVPEFIDLMIKGGLDPIYDTFYTDGTQVEFRIDRRVQDPNHMVVWADLDLKNYGRDWIVPNWIDDITIINGGIGYKAGDKLEIRTDILSADVYGWQFANFMTVSPARLTVMAVDNRGSITDYRLDSKGSYDIFGADNLLLTYQHYYNGTGTDAKISPLWGGDTIVFAIPPASSDKLNVHILYVGSTFVGAPEDELDIINDGGGLVDPTVLEGHPEELYLTRIHSSTRMDTYTQPVGGSPAVKMQIYLPDGERDHFPLGETPMDAASVIVNLDDLQLSYGLAKDYVIDFATNQVVFMEPPTGTTLQITTISTGGAGLGIYMPVVVSPGIGYRTGDIISLAGGSAINNDVATVRVTSVKGIGLQIVNGGKNYKPGDVLLLKDDNGTNKHTTLELIVVNTFKGAIVSVKFAQVGSYIYHPLLSEWETPGAGSEAAITIYWGIEHVSRYNVGSYAIHPVLPITQLETTGIGVGATFSTLYTSIVNSKVFTATGKSGIFTLENGVSTPDNMLITVDGVRIVDGVNGNISTTSTAVTISPTPVAYSTVAITVFSTSNFSFVCEQEIVIQAGVYEYDLSYPPYSSMPPYLSSTVTMNGLDMQGPSLNVYVADGYRRSWDIAITPANHNDVVVYIGREAKTITTDYTISGNEITFRNIPAVDLIITIVNLDPVAGYNYKLENNKLTLQQNPPAGKGPRLVYPAAGDKIKIITYSEDSSYKMQVEQFKGPSYPPVLSNFPRTYMLAEMPYSDMTTLVWVNNKSQTLLYDYEIKRADIPGWDIADWNVYGWEAEYPNVPVLHFGGNIASLATDRIQIQYNTGLPSKPAIAWRNHYIGSTDILASSTVISDANKTMILSPVMVQSTSIEIADTSVLFVPDRTTRGAIWINNERITYRQIRPAPTVQYPTRGFLVGLERGSMSTPRGNVSTLYTTIFYDGDGATTHFPTISGSLPVGGAETVYIENDLQINHAVVDLAGTYRIESNPTGFRAGRYVIFDVAPPIGWRNVKIAAPKREANEQVSFVHASGSIVIDASENLDILGGYNWIPSPDGLQYNDSILTRFLEDHTGTRS